MGRGNDQYIPYPRKHKHRDRVIDHRLVIDGHKLLADCKRERVETGAGAAGEDDTFA